MQGKPRRALPQVRNGKRLHGERNRDARTQSSRRGYHPCNLDKTGRDTVVEGENNDEKQHNTRKAHRNTEQTEKLLSPSQRTQILQSGVEGFILVSKGVHDTTPVQRA